MPKSFESPIKTLIFNIIKNPKRVASIGSVVLLWQKTYFGAQQKVLTLTDATIIETKMDDRVAHDEEAIYPYLFAVIYITFVAAFMIGKITPSDFKHAILAFRSMILKSTQVFLSHPTRMRDRDRLNHPLTRYTQSIDGPTNCFPSQHVSLVILAYQIIKDDPAPDALFVETMRKTCIEICRSTLKTKQHSMIDVIGGMVLAEAVYEDHFPGRIALDLLPELLPELNSDELSKVRFTILESKRDLPTLLQQLLQVWS